MTLYEIRKTTAAGETLAHVEADTPDEAARQFHPGASRVTGDRGLSGCFQGYTWHEPSQAMTSDGPQFWVG